MPRLSVTDEEGLTASVSLPTCQERLPGQEWTRMQIPIDSLVYTTGNGQTFDPQTLASLTFIQGLDDRAAHTLVLDDIKVYSPDTSDLQHIRIERSVDGGPFEPVGTQRLSHGRYADVLKGPGVATTYHVWAVDYDRNVSEPSATVQAQTRKMKEDELLTMVQRASFRYYREGAHPNAGLALENRPGDLSLVATEASGFGIMALLVGVERGFVTQEQGRRRMRTIIDFLERADRFHGAFPHFLDGRTGKVRPHFGDYDDGGTSSKRHFSCKACSPPASTSTTTSNFVTASRCCGRTWSGIGTAGPTTASSCTGTGRPTTDGSWTTRSLAGTRR